MNCSDLERLLERFLAGELGDEESGRCAGHLAGCAACQELEALARLAEPQAAPPSDLVSGVLARTSGDACAAAEARLCDRADGQLAALDLELVDAHLASCGECRALAGAVEDLVTDLPLLAELLPERGFVSAVLRRTLPWRVLLGRWWRRSWQHWVERPRFAAEAAYVATLVLVLIFATPGSPLEAMPQRAVELAGSSPSTHLAGPLDRLQGRASAGLEALIDSEGTRAILNSWERTLELSSRVIDRAGELAGDAGEEMRTLWDQAASLLQRADETPSEADENTDEETS